MSTSPNRCQHPLEGLRAQAEDTTARQSVSGRVPKPGRDAEGVVPRVI